MRATSASPLIFLDPITRTMCLRLTQYSQCTYNVTVRSVGKTIVDAEKQQVLPIYVCASVRTYMCVGMGERALACASARVTLLILNTTRCHIIICGLSGYTTLLDIIS